MSEDPFRLERFVKAQDALYGQVVDELLAGRKRSHWMWFIFPQLRGLGVSATSRFFGITSLDEAAAYLRHPLLGARLLETTELVLRHDGSSLRTIFGSPDDAKFRSSMTLFDRAGAPSTGLPFRRALEQFCEGRDDAATLGLLNPPSAV